VTIIGFVGADPEQRQARNNNGSKFTVLSVATQRSWKNTDDEWASKTEWHRVCVFRPRLAEYVATTIKKSSHVLVEGSLVSTTYERGNGKGKKAKTKKQTFWCISRRCRPQARSRRTRTGSDRFGFHRFE
jgi:single-strand DNA-binding protein